MTKLEDSEIFLRILKVIKKIVKLEMSHQTVIMKKK